MKERRMHMILKLLAGLMLFTGLSLGSICTKAEASSVTTPFEGDLTTDKTFMRPATTGDFNNTDTKRYKRVYYYTGANGDIWAGDDYDNERNYFVIKLVPSVSGSYTTTVTEAVLAKSSGGGGTDDTFLLLYSGGFDASKPLTNLVCANDDIASTTDGDDADNLMSTLGNISMTAGTEYYIVMTSFANGIIGHVKFTVTGPGAVNVATANAVAYNANGGSGAPTDSKTYYKGDTITLAGGSGMTKTGYTFGGWSLTQNGTAITTSTYLMGSQNMTFYAVWAENSKYTVAYDANTGSGSTPTDSSLYYQGDVITLQGAEGLSKTHYTFSGWSTTATGSVITTGSYTMVNQNVTFYAIWTENSKHSVTYNLNEGSGTLPSDSNLYYPGDSVTLQSATLTKEHYTFKGWSDSASGSVITGTTYTMGTKDVIFYAVWQEELKYTVTYDANTGSGSVPSDNTQYYQGAAITLMSAGSLTKAHYTFKGWSTTEAGNAITTSTYAMGTHNITFYAVWEEDPKYTVSYDANMGSGSVPSDSTQYYQGTAITLKTAGGLTRAHYTFKGWSTTTTGSAITTATYPMGTQNITFYAVWQENSKYTVTYYANGGSGSAPTDSKQYYEGEEITLKTAGSLTKTLYTFRGWATTATGSTVYTVSYIMEAHNVDLYAIWAENLKYTVTYDANTGMGDAPSDTTQYYEGEEVTLKTAGSLTKAHYTFKGWSTTEAGNAITTSTYSVGTHNIIFYAVWEEDPKYTVTYHSNGGNGTVPVDSSLYYLADAVTLASGENLNKLHYTFHGWSTTTSGNVISTATYPVGSQNIDFYAVWTENPKYTVTYNANTGTGTVPVDTDLYYEGDTIFFKTSHFTKEGYNLAGWATSADGENVGSMSYTMANKNLTFYAVWTPKTSPATSSGPASPTTTDQNVRQVNVNGGDSTGTNTVATVDIMRSVSDNTKTDSVVMDQDKTEEVLKKVTEQKQDLVQVVIDDVTNDQADAVCVTVKQASIDKLSEKDITLEVKTEDVTIQLPKETMQALSEKEEDLYFRVVPIRKEEDKAEVKQNAITAGVVLQTAGSSEVTALGTPMTIETNYQDMTTKVVFSLKDITIPSNTESRAAFLSSLSVYIQHNDGDEEVNHGTIIYDTAGNPTGIEIEISKFSTFTIVSIINKAPVASKLYVKGTVATGKTITAAYTYSDTENDAEGKSKIQWYRADNKRGKNKIKISGATKPTYKVTAKDRGKYLIVEVTPVAFSGELIGKIVSVAVKVTTVNKAPKAYKVKIAGVAAVGNTLTASYRYGDTENNKEATSVYQWYSADNEKGDNMQEITGATKLTYTITEEELGKYLVFKVTPVAKTGSKKGNTSSCITKAKVITQKSEYSCKVLLGLIKNKAYAESVAKLFETDYDTGNVEIKQEGIYYRVCIDFKDKKSAEAACENMISRKYIINYYYNTK